MREGWKLLCHAEQPGAAFVALIWQKVCCGFSRGKTVLRSWSVLSFKSLLLEDWYLQGTA